MVVAAKVVDATGVVRIDGDRRLERQLRVEILRLSNREEAFLSGGNGSGNGDGKGDGGAAAAAATTSAGGAAVELDVHDDEWVEQAAAVLEVDPDLSALRDRLVPRAVSEARFWQVRERDNDEKESSFS